MSEITAAVGSKTGGAVAGDAAGEAPETLRNYVGGQWVAVESGDAIEDRDPATGAVLARVPLSAAADVESAVRAAREAQPAWREVPPPGRARALIELRAVLDAHREELAALVTRDMGKTLRRRARRGRPRDRVGRGRDRDPAPAQGREPRGRRPRRRRRDGAPAGRRVAAITPFNFPAMIPLWFLPFAVACGNTFVLKPSEQDPLTSVRIFELIDARTRSSRPASSTSSTAPTTRSTR